MKQFARLFLATLAFSLPWLTTPTSVHGQEPAKTEYFGKPLSFWLAELKSTDPLSREEALLVIEKIGAPAKEAIPLIKPLLKDELSNLRFQAILTLWNLKADTKELIPVLKEIFPKLSVVKKNQLLLFVESFKEIDESVFPIIFLFDENTRSRIQFSTLQKIAQLGDKALPFVTKILDTYSGPDRGNFILMIPYNLVQSNQGELLAKYLKDPDPQTQLNAATYLIHIQKHRDAASDIVVKMAKSDNPTFSITAFNSIIRTRPVPKKFEEPLAESLKHKDLSRRLQAILPYLELRPDKAADTIPILEEGLKDTTFVYRSQTMSLLQMVSSKTDKLIPILMENIRKPRSAYDVGVMMVCLAPHADKVGKEISEMVFKDIPKTEPEIYFGTSIQTFAPYLMDNVKKHLDGEKSPQRDFALRLLRSFPASYAPKVLPTLKDILKKDNEADINVTLEVLERFGKDASPAFPETVALLSGPNGTKWVKSVHKVIRRMNIDAKDIEPVLKKLKEKNPLDQLERFLAADLALRIPGHEAEAAELVEPLFREKRSPVNSFELHAFAAQLGPHAVVLLPALETYFAGVNFWCKICLQIGPKAKDQIPKLLERVKKSKNIDEVISVGNVIYVLDPDQRKVIEDKISEDFMGFIERIPEGNVQFNLDLLEKMCRRGSGPSKALEPLLLKIFFKFGSGDIRLKFADILYRLDPKHQDEIIKAFEEYLGEFPANNSASLVGILKIKPDHPKALGDLKKYFNSPNEYQRANGLRMVLQIGPGVKDIKDLLVEKFGKEKNIQYRITYEVILMRFENKFNEAKVDELLKDYGSTQSLFVYLEPFTTMGPLAKPLIPKLRELNKSFQHPNYFERIIEILEAN